MLENDKGKICSKCGIQKQCNEFYTKGVRVESKCKECAKRDRVARYKKKKKEFEQFQDNRISKVVMKKNEDVDGDKFRRDLSVVKLMLEKLLVNVIIEEKNGKAA